MTHWNHSNIVRGISKWVGDTGGSHSEQNTRDFKTLEEHNKAIIKGINDYVGENDILWHLGDWSFGGFRNIWTFRYALKCKDIRLIYGNHDEHIQKNTIHEGVPAQSLFTSCDHYKEIGVGDGHQIIMSHFAMRVWNHSHKSTIHLYGHSHDSLEREVWGKSMDVGVDSSFRINGEYRPFALEEILKIMNKRQVKFVDHLVKGVN